MWITLYSSSGGSRERKKGYVLALTLIYGVSSALGVLYALLLRNRGHRGGAWWRVLAQRLTDYIDSFTTLGFRDARFTYEADDAAPVVLDDISVESRKGEYVAFTGHSGCGKSTVLKLLMCMYPQDGGEQYLIGFEGETLLDAS